MRKVAIIGRCYSTRADAPWNLADWEIWSLAWDPLPVTHRIFELHQNFRQYHGTEEDGDYHVGGLRMSKVPVYMLDPQADIPKSIRYPMDRIGKWLRKTPQGTPYLESSIAYMVALAIEERVDRIGIWGVDLHCDSEYAYQRPNLEYLVGVAEGRGIKIFIPKQSALFTHEHGVPYGYWTQITPPKQEAPDGP